MNKKHAVIEIEVLYVILFVCNCWIVQSKSKHDSTYTMIVTMKQIYYQ